MPGHAQQHSAVSCAKTAEPIEMPFRVWAQVCSTNHVPCKPAIFRGKDMPRHAQQHSAVRHAKMAKLTEMPFGWADGTMCYVGHIGAT